MVSEKMRKGIVVAGVSLAIGGSVLASYLSNQNSSALPGIKSISSQPAPKNKAFKKLQPKTDRTEESKADSSQTEYFGAGSAGSGHTL